MTVFGDLDVEACARAIREKNPRLKALVYVLGHPQRDEASQGPLAGVPYVLKDCWDTAGIPTTGGSWRHRRRVPTDSGPLHDALTRAGAVLMGKSSLSDLAFSAECANHLAGVTCNPFDETRTSGGSTGGGAVAVATGMAAFDWGGDFGGSIRVPAAACGIVGLRLSYAAWPGSKEQFPYLPPFFQPWMGYGPLARTVEGCRALVRALAPRLRAAVGETRARSVVLYSPDPRCLGAWPGFFSDAARALVAVGARFEIDRSLPPPSAVSDLYNGYLAAHLDELARTGEIDEREALRAVALALVSRGRWDRRVHPNTAVLLALAKIGHHTIFRERASFVSRLADLRARVHAIWDQGSLIVAPTSTVPPPRHGRGFLAWYWQAFAKLGNLADATCIAVPFGTFEGTRLPRSIQVLGPPGSEEAVMALAAKLEAYPS